MSNSNSADPKVKRSALSFLLWWNTDPAEVVKQVAQYDTLRAWQSARGTSMLLCFFSAVVTMLLGNFMHLSEGTIETEVAIWTIIGIFMYRGHRWAFILGMVLWTFEKGTLLFSGMSSGAGPIMQIFWWCIYMNAFLLGLRVENRRRVPSIAIA
jgi:hypothetical protein